MTPQELLHILNQPRDITLSQVYELENLVHKYPYFQAGRAIHLKLLYAQKSYRYNTALKKTAAHVGNRTALFHFITSSYFKESGIPTLEKELGRMPQIDYKEAVPEEFSTYVLDDVFEQVPMQEKAEQEVTPVDFSSDEQEEFNHYLEIEKVPIDREKIIQEDMQRQIKESSGVVSTLVEKNEQNAQTDNRTKKFDLIDKFLEANPKIEVRKDYLSETPVVTPAKEREIMTETLAKIYMEQTKYDEAIRAYSILMMKNPERTRYFAEQIGYIKELKQNNKQD